LRNIKKIVNDSFVVTRLKHQHRRTKEFKKQFKDAWSSLNECQIQLDNLKLEQIKAVADLKKVDSLCELVQSDSTISDKQRNRAQDQQTKRRASLRAINEQIKHAEGEFAQAKKIYQKKMF